jgi:cytochrome c553
MLRLDTARRMIALCRAVTLLGVVLAAGSVFAQSADPARGKVRAAACEACHGSAERLSLPGMPGLAGQQVEFLVLQMVLLREGLREVPQMTGMFNGLSDADITDMAAYFAGQTVPPVGTSRDPTLFAQGAGLSKAMGCGSCHLKDYRGQRQVPR